MDRSDIPSDSRMYIPVLEVLSKVSIITLDQLVGKIIEYFDLPEEILEIKKINNDKVPQIKNRLGWVCTELKKRGLIDYPGKRDDANRMITDLGRKVLEDGTDPMSMPILSEEDDESDSPEDPSETLSEGRTGSFFDYLKSKGLRYDTEAVEDFLLSLKAKQFVILSGGTGTGKTKLAQAYGEFISTGHAYSEIKLTVKLGKQLKDNGVTISRQRLEIDCHDAFESERRCKYQICGLEGEGKIDLVPRFSFLKDDEPDKEVVERLIEFGKKDDKAELSLIIPDRTSPDKRYTVVPVGSNWTDNRHILGYRNAISGEYERTDSLDLIVKSNEDPSNCYMLILDEMNLSHVERYFSDVISCMESREPINLKSDGNVPDSIYFGNNLFVVGTVNMDETTYTFSPKVLDRANVLEFSPPSIKTYVKEAPSYVRHGNVEFLQDPSKGIGCRRKNARTLIGDMDKAGVDVDPIVEDLESIQKIMSEMGLPLGYRTIDEVMRFMYVAWEYEGDMDNGMFNWKRYLDSQIHQKILPKIHGNVLILDGLKKLCKFCTDGKTEDGKTEDGKTEDENAQKVRYRRSKEKLDRMIKVLIDQRYVTFNC